ncbi:MAG: isopeptide-forming domain-containing fimbrial protein, partial [Pseudomonadota bacterium]
ALDGFNLTDTLDDRFQLTSLSISPAFAGTINTPTTIPPATPGGVIDIDFNPYTGAAGTDITVTVTGYVPQNDAMGSPVIDPATGTPVTIPNAFLLSGVGYTPSGGSLTALPDITDSVDHIAHALIVRQSTANQTDAFNSPGDTMRATATIFVSDYFTFDNVGLDTTAGDGTTRVALSETPAASVITGSDPTSYAWNSIGTLVGNEAGGTQRSYIYDITIDEAYATSAAVLGGDVLPMSAVVNGDIGGTSTNVSISASSVGTDGDITVVAPAFSKDLIRINGVAATAPYTVLPGDVLTFELLASVVSGDQSAVVLTDYLPNPSLDAQEHGVTPAIGTAGSGDPVRFSTLNTAPPTLPITVSTSPNSSENFLRFEVGAFQTNPSASFLLALEIDYTVTDVPQVDGLALTNLLRGDYAGTTASATSLADAPFVVNQPNLVIYAGATASSVGTAVFSPAAVTGPYSSTSLASNPVASDISNLDAGDPFDLTIVVENQGDSIAYDNVIAYALPPEIAYAGSGLTVTDGAGTGLAFGGDLFTTGLTVSQIPASDPTDGSNLVVITVPVVVQGSAAAEQVVAASASVTSYANAPGGANFVTTFGSIADASNVTMKPFTLTKSNPSISDGLIGDTATYTVTLTVPEGTHANAVLSDQLDVEAAFVATPSIVTSAGVTAGGSPSITSDGQTLTWNIGTLTNTDTDNATDETVTLTYSVIILNTSAANRNDRLDNTASFSHTGGTTLNATSGELRIREPRVRIQNSPSSAQVDAADTVTFTINLDIDRDTAYTVHDVVYTMTLPSGLTNLRNFTDTGAQSAASNSIAGDTLTVNFTQLVDSSPAQFSFDADVEGTVAFASSIGVVSNVTWTSQPGTPAN